MDPGSPDNNDVPPDIQVVLEDVDDPGPQAFTGLRVLGDDAIQDQVVFLVLLKLVHLFLGQKNHHLQYM